MHINSVFRSLTGAKLRTTKPKSGEDELRAIILEACNIEKKIQDESGMVVIQDPPLHWEKAYFELTTEDDTIATPLPNAPTDSASGPRKTGSIIDLTAASDDESPQTQKALAKAEAAIKQEIIDNDTVVKVTNKGKGVVKPVKDKLTDGGCLKVAPKTYRHGDGNGAAKTAKAETILANIAEMLSPQAQEKRDVSRTNLLRETMDQDRKDRVNDERVQELKLEIQSLKKELDDLRRENACHRDRAIEAATMLNVLSATNNLLVPVHNRPTPYAPAMPAFATNPSLYSIQLTNQQSPEPEGIAGPGPQTAHYRQQAAKDNGSEIPTEE